MSGEPLLEELTEEPTANADLKIFVNRSGITITSKGARVTLLVSTVLALVTLPIFLLWMHVEHDLPMSLFFYADGLGTAAILTVAIMALFGGGKKPH
ncbi:MAG TPA: hypothetical protein VIZ70_04745 [Propionibacteriaceae bacterium]